MPLPHLVVDISAHGFGHLAQTSAVLAALAQGWAPLRLTLRCAHPRDVLARFVGQPFERAEPVPEMGMAMTDPNRVDLDTTRRFYLDLHVDWAGQVAAQADRLTALQPDLLLCNVSDLSLAAAAAAGVPAIACCSLNWHDILAAYVGEEAAFRPVLARMLAAYRHARPFLRFTPGLPMELLPDAVPMGPIARLGRNRREEVARALGLPAGTRLLMASFGGIQGPPLLPALPRIEDAVWLVDDLRYRTEGRADIGAVGEVGVPFIDLVASADLVLTKPGYGTFADTICNGTRLLHFGRPEWPETAVFADWAGRHGVAAQLPPGAEHNGPALARAVAWLLDRPRHPYPPAATGGREAAAVVAHALGLPAL